MREMKDSGIAWIGEIPKEWGIIPFKSYFKLSKGLNITKGDLIIRGIPVINYGQIHSKLNTGTSINPELIKYVSDNYIETNPNCLLSSGAFIFADTSEDKDGCGNAIYVNSPKYPLLFAGYHTIIANPRQNKDNKFLAYLFLTDCWRSQIRSIVTGIKVYSINQKCLNNSTILLPPLSEQQRIATFLDEKCKEIDALIALQEEMITELQAYKQSVISEAVTKGLAPKVAMKDSGVEWIGEIPEHWRLVKFNKVCSKITDFVASGSFESLRLNVPYLDEPDFAMLVRTTDLSGSARSDKKVYISEDSYKFLNNSNLFGGEIVLPNIGASVGDVYKVPKMYEHMSLAPNSIMFLTKYVDNYYYYFYSCNAGRLSVLNIAQSTAQPKFNKTQLRDLIVPVPPLPEQQAIADYLDTQCTRIDSLIALKQAKIESLKEYKKSVIYEYVTGKKEVPATV